MTKAEKDAQEHRRLLLAQAEEAILILKHPCSPLMCDAAARHLKRIGETFESMARYSLPLIGPEKEQRALFWSALPLQKFQKPSSLVAFEAHMPLKPDDVEHYSWAGRFQQPDATDGGRIDPSGTRETVELAADKTSKWGLGHDQETEEPVCDSQEI